jgi:hypothetical protein
MPAVDLAVDALATFRLTRLLVEDEIAEPIRRRVWKRFDPQETKVGYLFTCPWCVSIWVGAAVVAARRVAPGPWGVGSTALALSAVTGLIATNA